MRKLLGIVVLGLLWSSNIYADTIPDYKNKLPNEEIIQIPVKVYIVDFSKWYSGRKKLTKYFKDNDFKMITTEEHIKKDFETANKIWHQVGIKWNVVNVELLKPSLATLLEDIKWMNENCNIPGTCFKVHNKKSEYLKSNTKKSLEIYNKLISKDKKKRGARVYYLPRMLSKNACGIAYTRRNNFKARNNFIVTPRRIIIGHKCENHNRGKTLAHELGHIVSLKHVNDRGNVMYRSITSGSKLEGHQGIDARREYKYFK